MKVFLSWSGELSHDVARVFAQMLPMLLEEVEPFEASENIEKGKRWGATLATMLSECSYGIICLTRSNLNMPWVLFEAGALSKLDTSHVAPFLLGLKPSEVKSPLADFQITSYNEEDVKRFIRSINASLDHPRAAVNLEGAWQMWWPGFKARIDSLEAKVDQDVQEPQKDVGVTNQETLEEILELVREQRRLLSSPETILSSKHLASVRRSNFSDDDLEGLETAYIAIRLLQRQLHGRQAKDSTIDLVYPLDLVSLVRTHLSHLIPDPTRVHIHEAQVGDIARTMGRRDRARRAESAAPVGRTTIADAEEQAAAEDATLSAAVADSEGQL